MAARFHREQRDAAALSAKRESPDNEQRLNLSGKPIACIRHDSRANEQGRGARQKKAGSFRSLLVAHFELTFGELGVVQKHGFARAADIDLGEDAAVNVELSY